MGRRAYHAKANRGFRYRWRQPRRNRVLPSKTPASSVKPWLVNRTHTTTIVAGVM